MEKEKGARIIAIVALFIAVVGVSVGFAALGKDLTISSEANVSPENNLVVLFSSSSSSLETDDIIGTVVDTTIAAGESSSATASDASINGTTISGLEANFTKPGQSVTYEFYTHNAGSFLAYLTDIIFEDADTDTKKVCVPGTGTTTSYAEAACEDITISITVGTDVNTNNISTTKTGIVSHTLDVNDNELVTVTISYPEGSEVSDGDFSVTFGEITLRYSTVNSAS